MRFEQLMYMLYTIFIKDRFIHFFFSRHSILSLNCSVQIICKSLPFCPSFDEF